MATSTETAATPPLADGDALDAEEFLRRYEAMPHLKKAELIDGVVHIPADETGAFLSDGLLMSSPVSFTKHAAPQFDLITWLGVYRAATPGVLGGDNVTVRLNSRNVPQPDACLFINSQVSGQSRVGADDFLHGPPEFVAEVAHTSVKLDLGKKLEMYQREGAQEYLVWQIRERKIAWFRSRNGRFEPLEPGPDGLIRSKALPGLWLDPVALRDGQLAGVLDALRLGLASPEHAAFVERLASVSKDA
jgi:Uma2 family endonuclease